MLQGRIEKGEGNRVQRGEVGKVPETFERAVHAPVEGSNIDVRERCETVAGIGNSTEMAIVILIRCRICSM
jgi:hypothetical protein